MGDEIDIKYLEEYIDQIISLPPDYDQTIIVGSEQRYIELKEQGYKNVILYVGDE